MIAVRKPQTGTNLSGGRSLRIPSVAVRRVLAKPIAIATILLAGFLALQNRIPLRTAVQIGADEGFELAKAALCLKGYKLYSDVWNDHPPLHTFLITQVLKLQRNEPLTPSLSPSDGERENSDSVRSSRRESALDSAAVEVSGLTSAATGGGEANRRDALSHYSPLGPRLVTVAFAALLLISVFIMALHSGAGVSPAWAEGEAGRERTQRKREKEFFLSLRSVRSFAAPLWTAGLATALLIASPGFLELSSSCMMEIPALAPAVAALCVLLIGRENKWRWREIVAGILFGIGLCMKLLGLILLPLAAIIVWLHFANTGSAGILAGKFPNLPAGDGPTRMSALPVRVSKRRGSGFRAVLQFLFPHGCVPSLLIVGIATAFTFVALDLLIDRGAFLTHFQQSWASHFAPAVSFEYGSPRDHRFPPSLLLRNWDMTVPAALGIFFLLRETLRSRRGKKAEHPNQSGKRPPPHVGGYHFGALALVPVVWLILMLIVFATHTPWWSYYYIHIAIPLSWCAAVGYVSAWSFLAGSLDLQEWAGIRAMHAMPLTMNLAPSPLPSPPVGERVSAGRVRGWFRGSASNPGKARRTVVLKQAGRAVPLFLFALCAAGWMSARVYLQITGIRNSPQTYYSLVLKEIERYKPFTEWIYADNLTYSFHSGIPMPPQLAVVPLKRLWSGDLTAAGVGDEVRKFKPGVIALRNDTRELPFQDLLEAEYRLVYHDAENRLYAHRGIANEPQR